MLRALLLALCLLQLAALSAALGEQGLGHQLLRGRRSLSNSGRSTRALGGDGECRSALSQALTLCRSSQADAPGAACCAALGAAGADCLRQAEVAAAGSAAAAETLSTVLAACGTSGGGSASSSKADATPSQLPAGRVQLAWSVDAEAAPCFNYLPGPDGNWTLDSTSGPWGAAGNSTPPAADAESASELLCSIPQDGGKELLQALSAGGGAAQAVVAAALDGCSNSSAALNAAFYEFGRTDELQESGKVLKYAEAFRDAAEAVGAGACVTVVVLDASGNLLGSRKVHTSIRAPAPTPDSSSDSGTGGSSSGTVSSSSVEVSAECQAAFLPALQACNGSTAGLGPGSGCCTAVEGVSEDCLGQLADSLTGNQTRLAELERILEECGIASNLTAGALGEAPAPSPAEEPSPGGAAGSNSSSSSSSGSSSGSSGGSSSGGVEDITVHPIDSSEAGSSTNDTLPAGRIALFLSIAQGPVPCYNYTPGGERNWTADPAGGLWKGTGSAVPPEATVDELSNALCGSPESGAAALLSAFEAGGAQAQAAVAIMLGNGSCLNPGAINAAVSAFGDSPELNDPALVLSYVGALVSAADEIGAGVCVSVAAIDRGSGSVLDFREVHVSGSSNSSSSSGNSNGVSSGGGNSSVSSNGSGSGSNGTAPGAVDGAVDIAAGGNGTLPELPAGKVLTAWSVGPSGQCAAYNASSGEWHNVAAFPFGGEGHGVPPREEYESLGKQLCQDAQQAADTLVEAMAAGGEEARIAVAALLSYNCPEGPPTMQAAFDAFTNATEVQEPETALRYVAAFVEAADAVGGGACVSLVVTSESGSVLAAYRVHSNGPAGGALLEEPDQQESDGGSSSNSSDSSGGGSSAAEALDWIHSFHADSQPPRQ